MSKDYFVVCFLENSVRYLSN